MAARKVKTKAKAQTKAKVKVKVALKATASTKTTAAAPVAFIPLDDRLMIQPDEAVEKTAGGLFIPGTNRERPSQGLVLAAGSGRRGKKGTLRPLDVRVGDRVLYAEYAGTKLNVNGKDILILREEEVLGVLN